MVVIVSCAKATEEYNLLSGTIPDEMGLMVQLSYLLFFANGLSGAIPDALFSLTALAHLDLRDMELRSSIPGVVANWQEMANFLLSKNKITGVIPRAVQSSVGQQSGNKKVWRPCGGMGVFHGGKQTFRGRPKSGWEQKGVSHEKFHSTFLEAKGGAF